MSRGSKEQWGMFVRVLQAKGSQLIHFCEVAVNSRGMGQILALLSSFPLYCTHSCTTRFLGCGIAQRQLRWKGHELGDADGYFRPITIHSLGGT